tara:strand:+ start:326 stop:502 length:177 start_codon:yes stop_codon:yes gene_type:complete
MPEKLKDIARNAPPLPSVFHGMLQFLDQNVKKPLEGTILDTFIFEPAKQYYVEAKRID